MTFGYLHYILVYNITPQSVKCRRHAFKNTVNFSIYQFLFHDYDVQMYSGDFSANASYINDKLPKNCNIYKYICTALPLGYIL